jgi:hypothetical protein
MIDPFFKVNPKHCNKARLIPSIPDSKKEEKATSTLLATFRVVPAFALEILGDTSAPNGKTAKVDCYTEVCFELPDKKQLRPDGLIAIRQGSKKWTALVESKIGNSDLEVSQIEQYLDLAKAQNIDALITISNQFVAKPSFHPVTVNKTKTRKVGLFHFSWISLVSKAILIEATKGVDDPEQVFILEELVRYFQSEGSGVSAFNNMGPNWKNICLDVQQGNQIQKNAEETLDVINNWHQLLRYNSLLMSQKLSQPVTWALSRKQISDHEYNIRSDIDTLSNKSHQLLAKFEIPNTAAPVEVAADFIRRQIIFSISLDSPADKKKPSACVNWITRQLRTLAGLDVSVRAYWPGRTQDTTHPLVPLFDEPELLIPENMKSIPTKLEVIHFKELAGKFSGSKNFVQEFIDTFEIFYEKVVQNLEAWKPKPPKIESKVKEKTVSEPKTEYYYFVADTEKQIGPISLQKLQKEVAQYDISRIAVWYTGLSEWKPLSSLEAKLLN